MKNEWIETVRILHIHGQTIRVHIDGRELSKEIRQQVEELFIAKEKVRGEMQTLRHMVIESN